VSDAFSGPPQACSTCHVDVHAGAFDHLSRPGPADDSCARCHTEESFHRARAGFDHAAATAFALTGAHARTDCESCHVPRARPDQHGRTFGVVAEAFPGPKDECATCHLDPHGDAFDRVGVPAVVGGASGCVRCHTTESFDAAASSFDHGSWTGFELAGAHARVDCTSCPVPAAAAAPGAFARARGTACQDCHADPPVGQFARGGRTDCSTCHTSATTFAQTTFDHQRDARFALDATHAKLACSSCHVSTPVDDTGLRAVRYKPLGTQCADCHDPRRIR
jgi:hypothetical protein